MKGFVNVHCAHSHSSYTHTTTCTHKHKYVEQESKSFNSIFTHVNHFYGKNAPSPSILGTQQQQQQQYSNKNNPDAVSAEHDSLFVWKILYITYTHLYIIDCCMPTSCSGWPTNQPIPSYYNLFMLVLTNISSSALLAYNNRAFFH